MSAGVLFTQRASARFSHLGGCVAAACCGAVKRQLCMELSSLLIAAFFSTPHDRRNVMFAHLKFVLLDGLGAFRERSAHDTPQNPGEAAGRVPRTACYSCSQRGCCFCAPSTSLVRPVPPTHTARSLA